MVALVVVAGAVAGEARAATPPGQHTFRVFRATDGLRNLAFTSIAQDRDGFLWIGTQDGVYRFDGESFTQLSVADGLPATLVLSVAASPDGRACAGTTRGLACWTGERFEPQRSVPAVPIRTLASHAGRLWVGTEGAGLFVGKPNLGGLAGAAGAAAKPNLGEGKAERAEGFAPAPGWPLAAMSVRALWADEAGLVVGNGAGVELSKGDGRWQAIGELGREVVDGVLRDRAGTLWVRTASHLWRIADRVEDVRAGMPTGYDASNVPASMAIGPRGDVLLATDDGIAFRDGDQWHTIDRKAGLPTGTVHTLFVDRDGSLWIGAAGLYQLRGRGLIERHDPDSGFPGETAWTFAHAPDGALLAGTNRCLARVDHAAWRCVPGTDGRVVRAIAPAPDGGVYIGGLPAGLVHVAADGRVAQATEVGGAQRAILAMAWGPDGALWIATQAGLYRGDGLAFARVTIPGVSPTARFASLAVDGDRLWLGAAPGGVYVLDHGRWHGFTMADGLRFGAASYVITRADGRVCAAYAEAFGVTCFRYADGRITALEHLDPAHGLATGMVYFLGEDAAHRLWVGTGAGVDVVTPTGVDHFDETDGLAGDDAAARAFLLEPDGSLWLGATGGATHVLAGAYRGAPPAPDTHVLAARLGSHDALAGELEVAHDQSALAIELAAGTLLGGKRVTYQVRLWPLEPDWINPHQRQVRYPVLLPGSYRFEARARIDAGAWGPARELRFTILPAWWQTGWFVVAMVVACAAAIAAGFALRQRTVLRQRTRVLMSQSEDSFRQVIDRMPDLIAVYRARQLIYLNQAYRRFLGVDGIAGVALIERVHPDDRAAVTELFRRIREDAVAEVGEFRVQHGDGSWRTIESTGVTVEIAGMPTMVASGRDITEKQRMRAKLMVADRMASLGTLAAGIAHEINNPLAYVSGNLEIAAEAINAARKGQPLDPVEIGTAIHDARDGADRVRKIVHGLRSFSRSEDEHRAPLALGPVLEAAIRLTANEVRHRAQLVRELGDIPLVIGDDGRLTQVFINLLVNAAHAIPEGHSDANRIVARTRTDEQGRAVVEIADTGTGMSADVQARVFDPFFTTKAVGEGTGLGLSICHGIISGLGGHIAVDSAPGRGTVIRVSLPAAHVAAPPPPPSTVQMLALTAVRRRVLLVDDEPLVAQTMERLLRKDFDVAMRSCGRDALELIAGGERFDAIVSDVMMPNMTGIELLEELRRVAPDQAARMIFLSGGAFTAQARDRLDELGAPQLEKPVSARELRACVAQIAAGQHTRAA